MALTSHFFYPNTSIQDTSFVTKPFGKAFWLKQNHIPIKIKTVLPSLKIKSSFRDQVFEDRLNGIICYADESGEIVCEGIDEGPRYHHQPAQSKFSNQRDSEILDLFQQRWADFVKGNESQPAADLKGVGVQGDFNCNGFNTLR